MFSRGNSSERVQLLGVLKVSEDPVELSVTKLPSTGEDAVAVASSSSLLSRSRWG